ncbi:MAG TPA: LuxR C-terminal-related transcriptional regulator [Mycobacteriales bacterium]|nr:LuxR C-terminal-related transcriptional regulator [Mycobacteriales bacterium]
MPLAVLGLAPLTLATDPCGLPCRTAIVRLARGHSTRAVEEAQAAAETFTKVDARVYLGRAYHLTGLAFAATGQRDVAITELTRARETFAAVGAHRLHDEASRALRQLGYRVSSRKPSNAELVGVQRLTAREAEIAGRVADGLTNAQIGQRLVLSTRTIDAHVRHIFTKLGVTSRAAVAATITTLTQRAPHSPSGHPSSRSSTS